MVSGNSVVSRSYLLPTVDVPYEYGFGGLPAERRNDEAIRRYLNQSMVVCLGTEDIKTGVREDTFKE
jgi:hypothetical protein